jgi:hypothetical protein
LLLPVPAFSAADSVQKRFPCQCCRWQHQTFPQILISQHAGAGTSLISRSFWFGVVRLPMSYFFTRRALSKVNASLQHE